MGARGRPASDVVDDSSGDTAQFEAAAAFRSGITREEWLKNCLQADDTPAAPLCWPAARKILGRFPNSLLKC